MQNRVVTMISIFALLATSVRVSAQTGDTEVKFDRPEEIVISQDVRDPDRYIDEFIAKTKDTDQLARLETIKTLDRDTKVKWLLGLSVAGEGFSTQAIGPVGMCVFVTVVVVTYVIVGYIVLESGKRVAIRERQEKEKIIKQCP